ILFLGAIHGGIGRCSTLTSWSVSKVQGGSACGPSTLWKSQMAVLVVWDVSTYVVRPGSHAVAPVFRELRCLDGVVLLPLLLEFLLLRLVRDWLSLLSLIREVHPLLSSEPLAIVLVRLALRTVRACFCRLWCYLRVESSFASAVVGVPVALAVI
ncbi:hypothetical protein Taro_040730, partial [Colocasia esculenta]|nr:hypothetical protein [Colocasia esculenta]